MHGLKRRFGNVNCYQHIMNGNCKYHSPFVSLEGPQQHAIIRGICVHMWTVSSNQYIHSTISPIDEVFLFGMLWYDHDYGHLFSHASSTFLVGWQTWSHESLRTRGNISGKGSTASFEIMLCDLDIQPNRLPKYRYFVRK